ncbi:LacI family DNA-binding transcriptional regulator [Flavobacterium sp. LB2P84]|jgi:DNA-binding LacI/PurR family transcriptional regulator|uniref:LacI family DNA-binding transcriptional regulator n=1 Tax=Flavobacterium yafengii TaxID=3041253 RepID=A0AAW6TN20_9FLAO|nr:LacI family DNA-binding transcriptional regulator [Flavobacterium yafengii]MDI5949884.1 LacI family DNA-binding transcriptional regulator [Flavobacterium yafengii]MDI6033857.1 LacI family DNA-binding transcriptional regulator [Flavobacterium yafengii]
MSKKTTIYDIAKKLNTTAATVSRALNNNPKISESTCKLVRETAAEMNYKPNKLALALQSGKSGNIGVIVPRIDSNFFASVIRGIEDELYPDYHVIICQTHEDEKREIENINTLLNAQVDGILMSVSNVTSENDRMIKRVVEKNVPLIFFDRKKNMDGVSSVTINDYDGAYLATKHLINEGCTRIAHFSGDRSLEIFENRFKGYKQALLDNEIEFNENYVFQTKSSVEAGRAAVEKLLKLENPPDAIFSSSDFAALGAIQELKEHGIKIPEDFCVFGFGNEPFTKFMELSISSVDQSPMEMGEMAAKVFLEQLNNPKNLKMEKKVVLNPELHIRKSSSRHSL